MSADGSTSSTRQGRTCVSLSAASTSSRLTWGERFDSFEKISTITVEAWIASTMAPAQVWPLRMSRGAIQQLRPWPSSASSTTSAQAWSVLE